MFISTVMERMILIHPSPKQKQATMSVLPMRFTGHLVQLLNFILTELSLKPTNFLITKYLHRFTYMTYGRGKDIYLILVKVLTYTLSGITINQKTMQEKQVCHITLCLLMQTIPFTCAHIISLPVGKDRTPRLPVR